MSLSFSYFWIGLVANSLILFPYMLIASNDQRNDLLNAEFVKNYSGVDDDSDDQYYRQEKKQYADPWDEVREDPILNLPRWYEDQPPRILFYSVKNTAEVTLKIKFWDSPLQGMSVNPLRVNLGEREIEFHGNELFADLPDDLPDHTGYIVLLPGEYVTIPWDVSQSHKLDQNGTYTITALSNFGTENCIRADASLSPKYGGMTVQEREVFRKWRNHSMMETVWKTAEFGCIPESNTISLIVNDATANSNWTFDGKLKDFNMWTTKKDEVLQWGPPQNL